MQPVDRIHFAGSFADNLPRGIDEAIRSANRGGTATETRVYPSTREYFGIAGVPPGHRGRRRS